MADDERGTSGAVPGMVADFMSQLRAATERLEDLTRPGGRLPSAPAPGAFALPGALSAKQIASVTDSIAAQRRSIEALKAQLSAFDEQLEVLESMLGPLAQWTKTWADAEQQLLNYRPEPKTDR